jgi:PAS domain S-box-containing protein
MEAVKVNLHCHSSLSDGELSPEALADLLARSGVTVAALTDHDTIEGLARFREALEGTPVRPISGVELTAADDGPVHLLAYGFDPDAPALADALSRARQSPDGKGLPVAEAIALVHRAGGRAFLAHPLVYANDASSLEPRLVRYREWGLDGIEAIYSAYPAERIRELRELARRLGLATSAGCDFHAPATPGLSDTWVSFPAEEWRAFRDLVIGSSPPRSRPAPAPPSRREGVRLDWRSVVLRILLPTALAIALLVGPLFLYLIPAVEGALLARKQEMIRELARSAASILQEYHDEERSGRLSREQAQAAAVERIRFLRYGPEGKDYFWVTDRHPRMVVHPYRPDLDGQDLTDYRDPKGNRIFVEAARLVAESRDGYLEYVWQWQDDDRRLEAKQSYVLGFEPWGWIIGTGLYIEDVRAEIQAVTWRVLRVTLVVAVAIALLLLFVAVQGVRLERQRSRAEEALHESHERYRTLVEASREGTALVLDGRFACANRTFLDLTGCTEEQLSFMEAGELFALPGGGSAQALLEGAARETGASAEPVEAVVLSRGGGRADVLLGIEPVRLGDRHGVSLVVRDLGGHKQVQAALAESQARFRAVAENLRVGVFRASFAEGFPLVEANSTARRLFGLDDEAQLPSLARVLVSPGELDALERDLVERGEVRDRVLELVGGRPVSLTATLVRDEDGRPRYCDAVVEDVAARQREIREQEALIAELQSAQLSLGRPAERFMREPVFAAFGTPVADAARLMARHGTDTLFVRDPEGEALGVVTDRDLRERVLARGLDPGRPLREVMSAPVIAVSSAAPGHEALALMQERDVKRLAVRDAAGAVVGVLRFQDLLRADHLPLAALTRGIRDARLPVEIADHRARLSGMVHALVDSGARPRYVCRAVATVTDAATQRLVDLAAAQLGPPPAPWAYLALGSQGRGEQTLLADQDSAIVFEAPPGADPGPLRQHFLALGGLVSSGLEQAGYPLCKGGMMASQSRWCRSLDEWQRQLRGFIREAEPQARLEIASFLDFRCVAGQAALARTLRDFVGEELAGTPALLPLLARDVAQYRPPKGLFGGLSSGPGGIDTKDVAAAIESVARLYALRHRLPETSTFDRLRRLEEVGAVSATGHEELAQAYDFVMTLRLRRQVSRLRSGQPADNEVDPRSLNHLEEGLLKQVFSLLGTFQKKIQYDFLGGAGL